MHVYMLVYNNKFWLTGSEPLNATHDLSCDKVKLLMITEDKTSVFMQVL